MFLAFWIVLLAAFSPPQSGEVDTQIQRYLNTAQAAERSRDYATAARQYEEILKLRPQMAIVRQSLAITYHLQNRFAEAIAEFQQAIATDPSLWGAHLFLGMDYYKSNRFEMAIAPLEKSIALNEKMAEPEARFWLGVTYAALERPRNAVEQLRRALALRPRDVEVLYRLALAYDQCAASAFRELGTVQPGAAVVSLLQAERFLTENRADIARLEYRRAVQLRPDLSGWIPALEDPAASQAATAASLAISEHDARANFELAAWLSASGDAKLGASILHDLAARKPADPGAAGFVARAQSGSAPIDSRPSKPATGLEGYQLLRQGRFRDAVPLLAAAEQAGAGPWVRLFLARAYSESDACDRAEGLLQDILAAEPRNADALHLLGRNYRRFAELTLNQMVEIDPDSYGVHELLGKRHEEKTEYEGAISEYEAALARNPNIAGVRYSIGNVHFKNKNYQQAEKWLIEELKHNPYHGLAHYRLGGIYLEQGKPDDAIEHLERALQVHTELAPAQFDLGRAYLAKGRFDEAIAMLNRFETSNPENDRVHYLLSNAYLKQGRKADAQAEMARYQELTRKRLERTRKEVDAVSESLNTK
jgi:tetratricopeptide (TPR) repeat protein